MIFYKNLFFPVKILMNNFNALFKIVDEKRCPLYKTGELLSLSERTLSCPEGKEVCLILVRDMTQLLFTYINIEPAALKKEESTIHNCSGCTGLIKFSLIPAGPAVDTGGRLAGARIDTAVTMRIGKVMDSEFLSTFPADKIDEILDAFRLIELDSDTILIPKGELNLNLYIVIEGDLIVEDGIVQLDTLAEGDLCGEMSYLGADMAMATVKTVATAKVLAIEGKVFGQLLGESQAVQLYMAKLLARRLRKSNAARAQEFETCMSGRIGDMLPAELFQVFHMHQKTGVLAMDLPGGVAKVSFREGCIINASYVNKVNQEAIFGILGEKEGNYKFTTGLTPKEMKAAEIGDFMMLLMEGVKRVDEG